MRSNIRRSLAVVTAASGIWALGAASASADTLPLNPEAGTGVVTDTVDTVKGAAEGVTQKLPTKSIPENGSPVDAVKGLTEGELPTDQLPVGSEAGTDAVTGAVDSAKNTAKGLATNKAAKLAKAQKPAKAAELAKVQEVAQDLQGATQGGLPQAPSAALLFDGIAGVGVTPSTVTDVLASGYAQRSVDTARATVAKAEPVVGKVTGRLPLPSAVERSAAKVSPFVGGTASDAARVVDNAGATTAPYAEGVVTEAQALGHGVTSDVAGAGAALAATGVPFAHTLGTGVAGDTQHLVANAADGVQQIGTVPGAGDLTDAANLPALPFASALPVAAPAL